MKAKVTLKEGFRYHHLDNSFVDVKLGDVIEMDDIPDFEREERLRAKHLEPLKEKPAPRPAVEEAAPRPPKK